MSNDLIKYRKIIGHGYPEWQCRFIWIFIRPLWCPYFCRSCWFHSDSVHHIVLYSWLWLYRRLSMTAERQCIWHGITKVMHVRPIELEFPMCGIARLHMKMLLFAKGHPSRSPTLVCFIIRARALSLHRRWVRAKLNRYINQVTYTRPVLYLVFKLSNVGEILT